MVYFARNDELQYTYCVTRPKRVIRFVPTFNYNIRYTINYYGTYHTIVSVAICNIGNIFTSINFVKKIITVMCSIFLPPKYFLIPASTHYCVPPPAPTERFFVARTVFVYVNKFIYANKRRRLRRRCLL